MADPLTHDSPAMQMLDALANEFALHMLEQPMARENPKSPADQAAYVEECRQAFRRSAPEIIHVLKKAVEKQCARGS